MRTAPALLPLSLNWNAYVYALPDRCLRRLGSVLYAVQRKKAFSKAKTGEMAANGLRSGNVTFRAFDMYLGGIYVLEGLSVQDQKELMQMSHAFSQSVA